MNFDAVFSVRLIPGVLFCLMVAGCLAKRNVPRGILTGVVAPAILLPLWFAASLAWSLLQGVAHEFILAPLGTDAMASTFRFSPVLGLITTLVLFFFYCQSERETNGYLQLRARRARNAGRLNRASNFHVPGRGVRQ